MKWSTLAYQQAFTNIRFFFQFNFYMFFTTHIGGGYIFSYEAMMLDYAAANAACMAKGGFLASIRTQDELDAVVGLLTQK